jgi:glucose-6-phosphate dehydrogenase assembly protein OpcA
VLAERRVTDVARTPDPIPALHQRAEDYAPGDTDLTWTRTTPWRTLLAGALDTATSSVVAAAIAAPAADPTAALLIGWLRARLGVMPASLLAERGQESISLRFANGGEFAIERHGDTAQLRRTGLSPREVPLVQRSLGDQLAEELRRLGADRPYGQALEACTGATGLEQRLSSRVHIWYDPEPGLPPGGGAL